jgi:hypothetical protein
VDFGKFSLSQLNSPEFICTQAMSSPWAPRTETVTGGYVDFVEIGSGADLRRL